MLEWLKRHAWKACILQKGIPSSNLGLSAEKQLNFSLLLIIEAFFKWQNHQKKGFNFAILWTSFGHIIDIFVPNDSQIARNHCEPLGKIGAAIGESHYAYFD